MKALIVTEPFADYAKGDQITDAIEMDDAMAEHSTQVVAVNLPDPITPAKDALKADQQA